MLADRSFRLFQVLTCKLAESGDTHSDARLIHIEPRRMQHFGDALALIAYAKPQVETWHSFGKAGKILGTHLRLLELSLIHI